MIRTVQMSPETAGNPIGSGDHGLCKSDFRQMAVNGWGDRFNAYAYSMAWFEGALYVGNSRGNLVMIHRHHPEWMKVWPVRTPKEFHDLDFRAQIWRFTPERAVWERIHQSPRVLGRKGKPVPRDIGYRSMAIHHKALYVAASRQPVPVCRHKFCGMGRDRVSPQCPRRGRTRS